VNEYNRNFKICVINLCIYIYIEKFYVTYDEILFLRVYICYIYLGITRTKRLPICCIILKETVQHTSLWNNTAVAELENQSFPQEPMHANNKIILDSGEKRIPDIFFYSLIYFKSYFRLGFVFVLTTFFCLQ
jgi:hypothetical protein